MAAKELTFPRTRARCACVANVLGFLLAVAFGKIIIPAGIKRLGGSRPQTFVAKKTKKYSTERASGRRLLTISIGQKAAHKVG